MSFKSITIFGIAMVLLFCIPVINSSAQEQKFDLSAFTPPPYQYQGLDAGFDLLHNFNSNKENLEYFSPAGNTGTSTKNRLFNAGGSGTLSWFRIKNSEKWQSEERATLYGGFGLSGSNVNAIGENRNSSGSGRITVITSTRYYFKPHWFVEFPVSAEYQMQSAGSTSSNYNSYGSLTGKIKNYTTLNAAKIDASVSAGYGRIENVSAAQSAWYMLTTLETENHASAITPEDIYLLAREISLISNTRYFDYRKRKITEMTRLDNYLKSTGKATAYDAAYFTTLNDYWNFANLPARLSGYRLYAGLQPVHKTDLLIKLTEEIFPLHPRDRWNEVTSATDLLFKAGYILEKPIGIRWQHSLDLSVKYGPEWASFRKKILEPYVSEGNSYRNVSSIFDASASYETGFYPNSRTKISFGSQISYSFLSGRHEETHSNYRSSFRENYLSINPGINCYYYFSDRLHLQGYAGGYYFHNFHKEKEQQNSSSLQSRLTQWRHQLNMSLVYSIF